MKNRIILHLDMDYFFAQVEERENPRFKGRPVVVGADPAPKKFWYGAGPKRKMIIKATGRGVVSTANYEARKYGIHSAMPISNAFQLCPEAVFLPVNMELYQEVSKRIMKIVMRYSKTWEIVGLDEAYLDLTFLGSYKKAENVAKQLKKEIITKEKLTSTIGIGPNKLIAKTAAQKVKPDGLIAIKSNQVQKFLDPLDVEDLPGVGPKTAERLSRLRISKVKELKKISKSELQALFGKFGLDIYQKARGIDETPVTSEEIIKSIGKEITFEKDTRDPDIIFNTFNKIIKNVYREVLNNNFSFRTITVICRFQGFETHTKSKTLKKPAQDLELLEKQAKQLLLRFFIENPKLIRLIGLRVSVV